MKALLERDLFLSKEMDSQPESTWLHVQTGSSHCCKRGDRVGWGGCASESIMELCKNTGVQLGDLPT